MLLCEMTDGPVTKLTEATTTVQLIRPLPKIQAFTGIPTVSLTHRLAVGTNVQMKRKAVVASEISRLARRKLIDGDARSKPYQPTHRIKDREKTHPPNRLARLNEEDAHPYL
jgi:hypothetical protein